MYKHLKSNAQVRKLYVDTSEVKAAQNSIANTSSIVFVTLAEGGNIDDVTISEHSELFLEWQTNTTYTAGAIRLYKGFLYRCVQAHTSQDDWTPDVSPNLWTAISDPNEEYPKWSQPIGSHDAYALGAKTTHNEKKWVSTVDGNVWEPGVYGWEEG